MISKEEAIESLEKILGVMTEDHYTQFDHTQYERLDKVFPKDARVLREFIYSATTK